jgi:hypothetical protein
MNMLHSCIFIHHVISSGCARTEGYYKISMKEKASYLQHAYNQQKAVEKAKALVC